MIVKYSFLLKQYYQLKKPCQISILILKSKQITHPYTNLGVVWYTCKHPQKRIHVTCICFLFSLWMSPREVIRLDNTHDVHKRIHRVRYHTWCHFSSNIYNFNIRYIEAYRICFTFKHYNKFNIPQSSSA